MKKIFYSLISSTYPKNKRDLVGIDYMGKLNEVEKAFLNSIKELQSLGLDVSVHKVEGTDEVEVDLMDTGRIPKRPTYEENLASLGQEDEDY